MRVKKRKKIFTALPGWLLFCLIVYEQRIYAIPQEDDWRGFYIGTKIGVVSTDFTGHQPIHLMGFLNGVTGGYQWQHQQFLLGLETDIQSLSPQGETNSGAIVNPTDSNNQSVITHYGSQPWLFTTRPRLGFTKDRWMVYTSGGLGLGVFETDDVFANTQGILNTQKRRMAKLGYVVGAGIETKVSPYLSLKSDYLYARFNQMTSKNRINNHLINLGLNYQFGNPLSFPNLPNSLSLMHDNPWRADIGARLFLSSGLTGAPNPLLNTSSVGNRLASRLVFNDLSAMSEEVFARLDHHSGLFLKGYLGAGSVTSGRLYDEDFPGFYAYSNTLSQTQGGLSYASADIGYAILKHNDASLGIFVGYHHYAQLLKAYQCTQLAKDAVCVPSSELFGFLGISEQDTFHSLRLGLSSQTNANTPFRFTAEVAYLPWVHFHGKDIHNARQLIGPEQSNDGHGMMLETILDYHLSPSWYLGLGGRYWTWQMRTGTVIFDFLGENDLITEPARFNANRYGGFLQVNYHQATSQSTHDELIHTHWQGVFLGGHLGGAVGQNTWSNPFEATNTEEPLYYNATGFGNKILTTGPLGGASFKLNWQRNQWVYGLVGHVDIAEIQGENTVFSGIGGVNAETKINFLGTLAGRVGKTFNHMLIYLDGGAVSVQSKYTLNANTGALTCGEAEKNTHTWGFTTGIGFEYALNQRWTTDIEYHYIGLAPRTVAFPSISYINRQPIQVYQYLNGIKLGVNFKLL